MTVRERFQAGLERVPGGMTVARLTLRTIDVCLDYRVTGLAAEAAFFMLLSLPPLVLGLFGGLGYVSGWIGPDAVSRVVVEIQTYAAQFLTEASISELLVPTVQDVLARGRPELVSVGFLLSLWSGSRALNVFIDTVSIMYGQKDVRGIIQLRALSLSLYTVGTLAGIVLLPIVLLGPSIVGAWLPPQLGFLRYLYWPTVLVVSVLALTSLYHVSTPRRGPWVRNVPGAVLAMTIWLLASYVVRVSLEASLGGSTIYGPLSAPIVLLIWLYALAIAILIGSGLNAATRTIWPVVLSDGASSAVHWHPWSERAVLQATIEDEIADAERLVAQGARNGGHGAAHEGAHQGVNEGAHEVEESVVRGRRRND
jgi:membrane protein